MTLSRPRSFALLALPLAGALALSGCFSGGSGSDSAEEHTGTGERISIAMLQPPRSGLSPLSDDAFKLSRWATAETLVVLDEEGTALPGLATEWHRDDDLTWHFKVRDGVKFHSGEPLTADAVVNSLQQAIDASPVPRILDGVDMTVKADGDDVVITTGEPDPLLPNRLSSPQLAILDATAYTDNGVDPVGTGTGPFELVSVDGIVGATLDRYDDYWGDPALASGIDVKFVPDGTARAAALRTGEAQVVEAIPAGHAATIDENLIVEVPMPRTNTLYLNTETGPFKDPAVRAAAREAVDRAAIIESVYEGRADIAEGLLGPALPWAAEYREEADYQKLLEGRAEPAKVDGVKITLGTFTDRAELPEVAVMIEQQLEAVGFDVQQDVREYQYIEADALDGKFDAFILSRATMIDSGDSVAYLTADFTCEGGFNIPQLCVEDVDKQVSAASETEAGDDRRLATMLAEASVLGTDAAIPLLHERVIQGELASVHDAARDPRERVLITSKTHLD
ncbi:MAG: ABC transporter substrate-binding protein [Leucobacter sp.]